MLQDAALTSRMGSLSTSGAEEIGEREELYLVSKNDFVEVLIKDVNSYPSPQMMRGYDRGVKLFFGLLWRKFLMRAFL